MACEIIGSSLFDRYIEKEGFEASIANDGETALKMFDTVNPDLILLDIMLPGMNGFSLCETCLLYTSDAADEL